MSFAIKHCQSCEGPLREFLDLSFHPPTLGFTASRSDSPKTLYPLKISRCDSCGLIQSGFATDPKILWGGDYYYQSGATKSFAKHLDELAERMMREFRPKFVVDIGSNDGTSLMKYQEAGIKVLGVDPSSVGKNAKVITWNDFFGEKIAQGIVDVDGKADVITAFNVFAHVADLDSFMRGVSHLLADDGVFLTESQYLIDIIENTAYDTFYLEHLRTYSLHTLISLLRRYGFEVFKAQRIPTVGGSIRVFASKAKFRPSISGMTELLNLETKAGLHSFGMYAEFAERVKQSRIELNSLLWRLKKEGNRIVGIGAPGRSTTIITYCGLGPDLIDYLVETSPLKIGHFSPGAEIPVVDEERLIADQPDYAINFNWHLPELVPKLRAKGFKGKVIVPLPEVKVLG